MYYIVQENVFRESHYNKLIEVMDRMGLEYKVVRIFPFVDKIVALDQIEHEHYNVDDLPEFTTDRKDVFVFGAIKLARISLDRGWNPGSLMNDNHDFLVYREHYRENLLNWDSYITTFSADIPWMDGERKFMRPCKDSKAFTGKSFSREDWRDFVTHHLNNGHTSVLDSNTEIQVSSVKRIYKEIRFWVVGGKIITGSQYRLGNQTIYDPNFDPDALDFAQSMVDKFQLAEAFVIDVCLSEHGWKIVECGCINCAGFYCSDLQKTLTALEDFYDPSKISN